MENQGQQIGFYGNSRATNNFVWKINRNKKFYLTIFVVKFFFKFFVLIFLYYFFVNFSIFLPLLLTLVSAKLFLLFTHVPITTLFYCHLPKLLSFQRVFAVIEACTIMFSLYYLLCFVLLLLLLLLLLFLLYVWMLLLFHFDVYMHT